MADIQTVSQSRINKDDVSKSCEHDWASVPPDRGSEYLKCPAASSHPLESFRQSHDPNDFAHYVSSVSGLFYRIAFRLTGNHHSAEDMVQISFLKILKSIDTVRDDKLGPGGLDSWAKTIVENTARDYMRAMHRRRENVSIIEDILGRESATSGIAAGTVPVYKATSVEAEVEHQEFVELLQEGMAALPDNYRSVLDGVLDREASYQSLADEFKIPMSVVRSRLHRARQLLRHHLKIPD